MTGAGMHACVTAKLCPAMVSVPLRDCVPPFAATVTVVAPEPEPVAGATLRNVDAVDTVHGQPTPAMTVTLDVPPAAPTFTLAELKA